MPKPFRTIASLTKHAMGRRQLWIAAALAAASAAVICAAPAQYLGRQQDDLLYIITSHSLSEGGYRLLTCPGQPPMTFIMPGMPLLLLPVTWLWGERCEAYQVFSSLVLAGLPWLLWWWLRRRLDEGAAVLIALLFATSPLVLSQAGTVMSEAPYTALTVLLLAACESNRWGRAGVLLLALTQLRPAGLSLFPAVLEGPWRRRDWRAILAAAVPALAAAAAWWLWSWHVSGGVDEARELGASYGAQSWRRPLAVAFDNARCYLSAWGGCFLPARWSAAAWLVGAGLAGLAIFGAARLRRRLEARPALLMLAGAACMHALWPWQYERYLIPLLPWLFWLAAEGAGKSAVRLLAVLLALQTAVHVPVWVFGRTDFSRIELERTYSWLRTHTAPADALASLLFVRDGFQVARPSLPLPRAESPERFASELRRGRARLVLWQEGMDLGLSLSGTAAPQRRLDLAAAALADPRLFRLVHEEPGERTRIYALR